MPGINESDVNLLLKKGGERTSSNWLRNASVIPPDIEPTKSVVCFCACGGTKCICCCCARADIEGPWP